MSTFLSSFCKWTDTISNYIFNYPIRSKIKFWQTLEALKINQQNILTKCITNLLLQSRGNCVWQWHCCRWKFQVGIYVYVCGILSTRKNMQIDTSEYICSCDKSLLRSVLNKRWKFCFVTPVVTYKENEQCDQRLISKLE